MWRSIEEKVERPSGAFWDIWDCTGYIVLVMRGFREISLVCVGHSFNWSGVTHYMLQGDVIRFLENSGVKEV